MILTNSGVLKLMQRIKSYITSQLNTKAASVHTHSISEIDNLSSQLGGGYTKSEVDTLLSNKANSSHTHSKSEITDFPTIPTKTSDLTNDSFVNRGNNNNTIILTWDSPTTGFVNLKVDNTEMGGIITHNNLMNYGFITANYAVPRSGGAVMTTNTLGRTVDNDELRIDGGTGWNDGASIGVSGKNRPDRNGHIVLHPATADSILRKDMWIMPDGTWTWTGSAVQLISDQRYKQQIAEIDDKLLDAWEDVELVQFKYNDAVEQKGKDNARLHTGYVVQQIDEACQKHNIDISEYGLYCHEEYPERTEEVTIEYEDGTTSKETKVIEPAREYYSLRYTETLVVECAYLRRENDKLKQQFKQLKETVNELKSIINCSEIPNS